MPRLSPRLHAVLVPLLVAAAIVAAAFAAVVGLVWWRQERIVFQPPGGSVRAAMYSAPVVDYRAADGQLLHAYIVRPRPQITGLFGPPPAPVPEVPLGVIMVFHGNADLAGAWVRWGIRAAGRTGWAVVIPEYRGYGGLPGTPTYEGSRLDARAAYAFVRDSMGARPDQIAIYGHSLGSAIGAELAAEVRPRALLLESPFTSARAMARLVVLRPVVALWRVISRVHYDTEARVRALNAPVHVVHGERDRLIPVQMGRAVHAAARVKGGLLLVPAAGHNDVHDTAGEAYWRWLEGALGTAP